MAEKPRTYETFYLVRPDINDEELSNIQDKLSKSISENSGTIVKSEKWADRNLAYPINDFKKGSYYILNYSALPKAAIAVEKHLQFHKTDVLRFITTKALEDNTAQVSSNSTEGFSSAQKGDE